MAGVASNPLNDSLPEQALRADQEERQRDEVSEPALDPAAEQRSPIELAELFADADDEAADDRARNGSQVRRGSDTGNAFSATTCSANDTSDRAPQNIPVASATTPAVNQTMTQI